MKFKAVVLAGAVILGLAMQGAGPRHAANAFDRAHTLTVTGTFKQFRWSNPHTWLYVEDVPNGSGATLNGCWKGFLCPC
jgi:hypothetical protein